MVNKQTVMNWGLPVGLFESGDLCPKQELWVHLLNYSIKHLFVFLPVHSILQHQQKHKYLFYNYTFGKSLQDPMFPENQDIKEPKEQIPDNETI